MSSSVYINANELDLSKESDRNTLFRDIMLARGTVEIVKSAGQGLVSTLEEFFYDTNVSFEEVRTNAVNPSDLLLSSQIIDEEFRERAKQHHAKYFEIPSGVDAVIYSEFGSAHPDVKRYIRDNLDRSKINILTSYV